MNFFSWKAIDLNQKPNQRERIIFALALLFFLVTFVRSCWVPSHRAISEVKNQLRLMEAERGTLAQVSQLKTVIKKTKGEDIPLPLTKPMAFVGSVKEMEATLGRLSEPRILKGVRLLKSRFAEMEREGNLLRRRIELELVGGFQGLGRYLNALESMPAPLWIEAFSIKTGGDKLSAKVRGSVYGIE